MSGGSETTTTEQTREPWAPAADLIKNQVLPGLSSWGSTPQQYTGPTYVDPTRNFEAGTSGLEGYFGGAGRTGVVDPAMAQWRNQLDPSAFLSAPGAAAPLDWYATQVGRNLNENIRPGYGVEQAMGGQYGGYSGQRAQNERLAERQASESIANMGAQLAGNLWNQGLNASQNAVGMAPTMFNLGQQPYQGQLGLDRTLRGEEYTQQGMENQRRAFDQSEQLQRVKQMFGLLGPAANLGGTMVGTQVQESDPGLMGAIMPALSLGLGAMGAGGPLAAGGALAGLLGGGGGATQASPVPVSNWAPRFQPTPTPWY